MEVAGHNSDTLHRQQRLFGIAILCIAVLSLVCLTKIVIMGALLVQ